MAAAVSSTSSSSSGQNILTALNASNGMDMTALATNLAAAEKATQQNILDTKKTKLTAQVSSIGKIMTTVDSFALGLSALGDPNTFQRTPQSSDPSKVAVEFLNNSVPSNFSNSIAVTTLATESSLRFSPKAGLDASLLSAGSSAKNLVLKDNSGQSLATIDLTIANSLTKLRDALNDVSGFNASIIQGGTSTSPQYYLTVKRGTGSANQFSASVIDSGGASVTDPSFDPASFITTQGTDAVITVDGISVQSADGVFKNVIPGVSLTALGLTGAAPVIASSTINTDALTNAVSTLVSGFNTMVQTISTETAFNEDPTKRGGLSGDSNARALLTQLRNFTTQPITGYDEKVRTFSDIGISTNRDGTLSLDVKSFAQKLKSDPTGVEAILASKRSLGDSRLKMGQTSPKTQAGVYTITKADASSWTINGQSATLSLGMLIAGDTTPAQGLTVLVPPEVSNSVSTGYSTKLYYSKGLLERFNDMLASVKDTQSPLQSETTNANTALKQIDADQTKLNAKETATKQRYLTQFTALQTLLSANKDTATNLTNFMTAWSSSLKNN